MIRDKIAVSSVKIFCEAKNFLVIRIPRYTIISRPAAKFEKLRTRFENTGAVANRDINELKGHVTDGSKGPAQALKATTLKQLPPFVYEA